MASETILNLQAKKLIFCIDIFMLIKHMLLQDLNNVVSDNLYQKITQKKLFSLACILYTVVGKFQGAAMQSGGNRLVPQINS